MRGAAGNGDEVAFYTVPQPSAPVVGGHDGRQCQNSSSGRRRGCGSRRAAMGEFYFGPDRVQWCTINALAPRCQVGGYVPATRRAPTLGGGTSRIQVNPGMGPTHQVVNWTSGSWSGQTGPSRVRSDHWQASESQDGDLGPSGALIGELRCLKRL